MVLNQLNSVIFKNIRLVQKLYFDLNCMFRKTLALPAEKFSSAGVNANHR